MLYQRCSIALIALFVCLLDSGYAVSQAAAPVTETPKAAADAVISMFTPNEAVNVDATGKPLPTTGTWGVQTTFPEGTPKACALARIPCVMVVYRVPEEKIVCEWTVGFVNAVEPQPDGTIKHAMHVAVLDENAMAARYTMKKAWARGEAATPRREWTPAVMSSFSRRTLILLRGFDPMALPAANGRLVVRRGVRRLLLPYLSRQT